jgi:hypothetical protein
MVALLAALMEALCEEVQLLGTVLKTGCGELREAPPPQQACWAPSEKNALGEF